MLAFLFIRMLAGVVPVWAATFNVDRTDDDALPPHALMLRPMIVAYAGPFDAVEQAFGTQVGNGIKVSRYERFDRKPALETALACKAVFQVPVEEIFAGV